jgi:hypothetical protein
MTPDSRRPIQKFLDTTCAKCILHDCKDIPIFDAASFFFYLPIHEEYRHEYDGEVYRSLEPKFTIMIYVWTSGWYLHNHMIELRINHGTAQFKIMLTDQDITERNINLDVLIDQMDLMWDTMEFQNMSQIDR